MMFVWVSEGSDVCFVEDRAIAFLQCWQQDEGFDLYFVSKDESSIVWCVALRVQWDGSHSAESLSDSSARFRGTMNRA